MKTELPFIYICALMRTGSTMLQELLMEPGKCFIFHEPWFGSSLFENQQLTSDIFDEWKIPKRNILQNGISSPLMFLRLSKVIPQMGVKEIRHSGWEMYRNLFKDIRFVLLGRHPRDLFISTYHFRQNWKGFYSPYDSFSVDNLFNELKPDIDRQLEIFKTQSAMKVRYEELCRNGKAISNVKEFVNSEVKNGVIGYVHDKLERNKSEFQHKGKLTIERLNRYESEEDPILKLQADEFYDRMGEYNKFWGY